MVYEINTWAWLAELSRREHRRVDLGSVPEHEWDRIAGQGFDAVWLMGVWQRSPVGVMIAVSNNDLTAQFDEALPDWRSEDVVGSPYCVRDYVVDDHLGGREGLALARETLADHLRACPEVRELQRHVALMRAIGAFSQPHAGHAAVAQFAHQPVCGNALPGFQSGIVDARGRQRWQRAEKVRGFDGCALTQQPRQRRLQQLLFRRESQQPLFALGRRQVERSVQQAHDPHPLFTRQVSHGDSSR
jgi:hypothetical protein